jgi:fatty acyl-CoA reductase
MDLFNMLRKKYGLPGFQSFIQEKVVPLAGDIIYENFGLDNSRADALSKDINVIINGAATTNFYERYSILEHTSFIPTILHCTIKREK